ncbi:hypothetical protein VNI00_001583 [Paramarasmius palmivorus]|uniref:Uncharacterized protein n=1 Tax=Paramarasmius palmivorus TaxID=297713 RepID=A0AAW0E4E9_9AGAR
MPWIYVALDIYGIPHLTSYLMGSLCSKPGTHSGGHTVLGSSADTTSSSRQAATSNPGNPRSAAAEAAERRMKAAQERGTNTANPNRGKLAAQANKPAKFVPEERQEERLVWD